MTGAQWTLLGLALAAGLLAASVAAVAVRRVIIDALDQRRAEPAGAVRAVVSSWEVEQRKIDASVSRCDTVQIGPIPEPKPPHTPRHATPDEPEDRTYLLAKLDQGGYPADRLASEADR